jgi:hypothetical protein
MTHPAKARAEPCDQLRFAVPGLSLVSPGFAVRQALQVIDYKGCTPANDQLKIRVSGPIAVYVILTYTFLQR